MDHDNLYIADDRLAHIGSEATGDTSVSLFPDADKLVHAVMFGMLTIGILADRQRQTGWKEIPVWMATLAVAVASGTGAGIEFLQGNHVLRQDFRDRRHDSRCRRQRDSRTAVSDDAATMD